MLYDAQVAVRHLAQIPLLRDALVVSCSATLYIFVMFWLLSCGVLVRPANGVID